MLLVKEEVEMLLSKVMKLAILPLAVAGAFGGLAPAYASTQYEDCVRENCFGQYQGDGEGYRLCVNRCRFTYPPEFAALPKQQPMGIRFN